MLFNGHLAPRILIDHSLPPGSSTLHPPPPRRHVSVLNDRRRRSASELLIIGMIPMAMKLGEGGEQYTPMARAIIGGGAFFRLLPGFLLAAAYLFVFPKKA